MHNSSMAHWKLTVRDTKKTSQGAPVWEKCLYVHTSIARSEVQDQIAKLYAPGSSQVSLDFRPSNSEDPPMEPSVLLSDMLRTLQGGEPSPFLSPDVNNKTCCLYLKHAPGRGQIQQSPVRRKTKDVKQGRAQAVGAPSSLGLKAHTKLSKTSSRDMRKAVQLLLQREEAPPHCYVSWIEQPQWARTATISALRQLCSADDLDDSQLETNLKACDVYHPSLWKLLNLAAAMCDAHLQFTALPARISA